MHSLHESIVHYIIKFPLTDNIQLMMPIVSTLIWHRGFGAIVFTVSSTGSEDMSVLFSRRPPKPCLVNCDSL